MTPHELESFIAAHPAVLQCAVVIKVSNSGEPALIAHYVLRRAAALSATELRAHLAERLRLPVHLVPVELRRHAAFPLGRNGTVELGIMS